MQQDERSSPRPDDGEDVTPSRVYEDFEEAVFRRLSAGGGVAPVGVTPVVGEHFTASTVTIEDNVTAPRSTRISDHSIPVGRWRDGLCACCSLGCWHPLWWLACFLTPCALGQVMTRLKLNFRGGPLRMETAQWTTFQLMFVITLYYMIAIVFCDTLDNVYQNFEVDENGEIEQTEVWVEVILAIESILVFVCMLYMWLAVWRVRRRTRNRYAIPQRCYCEDCCCSCCCPALIICQMGRHTANYSSYKGYCCTDTGLERGAPMIV